MDAGQRPAGVAERIKAARLDEGIDGTFVADTDLNLVKEVRERGERPLLLPGGPDRVDDRCPDVANGTQPEANVGTDRCEIQGRLVDVWRQHADPHLAAFRQIHCHLVLVVPDGGEQGGHELGWIVRLQISGPERHDTVAGGVRLVESVTGEREQNVPDRLRGRRRVALVVHTRHELGIAGVQDLLLLLPHGAAQQVRLTEAVTGELTGDGEHMLLVDDEMVGLTENSLEHVP